MPPPVTEKEDKFTLMSLSQAGGTTTTLIITLMRGLGVIIEHKREKKRERERERERKRERKNMNKERNMKVDAILKWFLRVYTCGFIFNCMGPSTTFIYFFLLHFFISAPFSLLLVLQSLVIWLPLRASTISSR